MTGHMFGLIAGLSIIAVGNSWNYRDHSALDKIALHCGALSEAARQNDTIEARYQADLVGFIAGKRDAMKVCAAHGVAIAPTESRKQDDGMVAELSGRTE